MFVGKCGVCGKVYIDVKSLVHLILTLELSESA